MITIVRKHFSIDHPSDIYTPITDPSKSCQLCISHWKAQLIYFVKHIIVGLFCLNSFQSSWGCSSVGRVCLQCIKPWVQIPALKRWRLEDQKLKAIIGCIVISEWATWNCLKNKKTMGLDTSGQDRSLHLLGSLLLSFLSFCSDQAPCLWLVPLTSKVGPLFAVMGNFGYLFDQIWIQLKPALGWPCKPASQKEGEDPSLEWVVLPPLPRSEV